MRKNYDKIQNSEESDTEEVESEDERNAKEEDNKPRMSLSLSRALTSPDSIAMSECVGEGVLDCEESAYQAVSSQFRMFSQRIAHCRLEQTRFISISRQQRVLRAMSCLSVAKSISLLLAHLVALVCSTSSLDARKVMIPKANVRCELTTHGAPCRCSHKVWTAFVIHAKGNSLQRFE